jgi:branched-chain amino acid transport system ATP-binding protein
MLLSVEGLSAGYGGVVVLRDVSLAVPEGSIATLLGPNGAGKTTLLRAISGIVTPRRGRVVFDSRLLNGMPPEKTVKLGIAHVPEGRGIFPGLTVHENLRMGLHGRRLAQNDGDEAIERVFSLFPLLSERLGQPAGTLSGGEQQMLAIGRALLTKPRLMMIDELSLGLAPMVVQRLLRALVEIRAAGVTVLLIDQFARLVLGVADMAFLLERGTLTFSGTSRELLRKPSVLHGAYLAGRTALQEVGTP